MAAPIPSIMVVNTFPPPRPSMPLWKTSRPGPSATPQRRETDWGPPPPPAPPRSKIDATLAIAGMMTMSEAGSLMYKALPPVPKFIVREDEP